MRLQKGRYRLLRSGRLKIERRNFNKLLTASQKGMGARISLMVKEEVVYSLSLRSDYMKYLGRKEMVERAQASYENLGVFSKRRSETLYEFFCRLWDEVESAGLALPSRPSAEEFSQAIRADRWSNRAR
jgi:hypothetical protein